MENLKVSWWSNEECRYLTSPNQVENNAGICKADQPIGIVEAKPCEKIPRSIISEGSISDTSARQVEEAGDGNCSRRGSLHCLVLWWRWLQRVLQPINFSSTPNISVYRKTDLNHPFPDFKNNIKNGNLCNFKSKWKLLFMYKFKVEPRSQEE